MCRYVEFSHPFIPDYFQKVVILRKEYVILRTLAERIFFAGIFAGISNDRFVNLVHNLNNTPPTYSVESNPAFEKSWLFVRLSLISPPIH